jgi:hypothetical protein
VAQTAGQSGDSSGRARFCRILMWHPVSRGVPYRFKYRISTLATAPHFSIYSIFLSFFLFGAFFSWFLASSRLILFFSTFYLISRYFVLSFNFFQLF